MSDIKAEIKDLYKIFGANPKAMVDHVKNGVGKPELLESMVTFSALTISI